MSISRRTHIVRHTALVLAASLLAGIASAQYVGPSTAPIRLTIADVLKDPVDDAQVTFTGVIVKKVGTDKYLFPDGISQIRMEIDRKYFPATPLTDKTKVRIRGEVEKEFLESPEIDVDHLEIVSSL